jgi:hypothetical protein
MRTRSDSRLEPALSAAEGAVRSCKSIHNCAHSKIVTVDVATGVLARPPCSDLLSESRSKACADLPQHQMHFTQSFPSKAQFLVC